MSFLFTKEAIPRAIVAVSTATRPAKTKTPKLCPIIREAYNDWGKTERAALDLCDTM